MATHSSILLKRILWTEEPGGLPPMGSHRVRHDWSNLAVAAAAARNIFKLWQYFYPDGNLIQLLVKMGGEKRLYLKF